MSIIHIGYGGIILWTREALKRRAKITLSTSYWSAFVVSLAITIMGGRGGAGYDGDFVDSIKKVSGCQGILPYMVLFGIAVFLIGIAFRVFIGYALEVGGRRYFIQASQSKNNMNELGFGFRKPYYFNIISTMLWRAWKVFLWLLLLVIPGIIKTFAYRMVPYILADNPGIPFKRAVELSDDMTKGHKWAMWVLDLSFLGWYLLGFLACFVGVIFVIPYQDTTEAELYIALRQEALDRGICSYEELNLSQD